LAWLGFDFAGDLKEERANPWVRGDGLLQLVDLWFADDQRGALEAAGVVEMAESERDGSGRGSTLELHELDSRSGVLALEPRFLDDFAITLVHREFPR